MEKVLGGAISPEKWENLVPRTGTTPGSRVKVPNMGQSKQLNLGHPNKYPHEAAMPGPTMKHMDSKVKYLVERGLGMDAWGSN